MEGGERRNDNGGKKPMSGRRKGNRSEEEFECCVREGIEKKKKGMGKEEKGKK